MIECALDDRDGARHAYGGALQLFERVGDQRGVADVREALIRLDTEAEGVATPQSADLLEEAPNTTE